MKLQTHVSADLIDRLERHVMGPKECPKCDQTRGQWDFDRCKQEGQCDWNMDYSTSSSAFDDPWRCKEDILTVVKILRGLRE